MYKGIIFDLDGTLADTIDDIAGSMNRVLLAHGFPVRTIDEYKYLVGKGLDNLVVQALPQAARHPLKTSSYLAEMIADYSMHCMDKTRLYKGIPELLEELIRRNLKLAVFSNKSEPLTIRIVARLMAEVRFVKVIGARSDLPKKPDPYGALMISDYMGLPPAEIVYVGDTDVDMITANQAGMFAVGVSWGFRSKEELLASGARIILGRPGELLEKVL